MAVPQQVPVITLSRSSMVVSGLSKMASRGPNSVLNLCERQQHSTAQHSRDSNDAPSAAAGDNDFFHKQKA